MLTRLDFQENPNVGVFCRANDDICFIRKGLSKKITKKIVDTLDVELVFLSISDASIIGSLLVFNKNGCVVCDFADEKTIDEISNCGFKVYVIDEKINAAGNDILANDKGVIVHPDYSDETLNKIKDILKVDISRGTIGGLKTVGMAAYVTNKGLLCHPKSSDDEIHALEKLFDVNAMIGTVNHGVPLIGSGLVANTKGAIIGNQTTGIEMGRIEEALGFLD